MSLLHKISVTVCLLILVSFEKLITFSFVIHIIFYQDLNELKRYYYHSWKI